MLKESIRKRRYKGERRKDVDLHHIRPSLKRVMKRSNLFTHPFIHLLPPHVLSQPPHPHIHSELLVLSVIHSFLSLSIHPGLHSSKWGWDRARLRFDFDVFRCAVKGFGTPTHTHTHTRVIQRCTEHLLESLRS